MSLIFKCSFKKKIINNDYKIHEKTSINTIFVSLANKDIVITIGKNVPKPFYFHVINIDKSSIILVVNENGNNFRINELYIKKIQVLNYCCFTCTYDLYSPQYNSLYRIDDNIIRIDKGGFYIDLQSSIDLNNIDKDISQLNPSNLNVTFPEFSSHIISQNILKLTENMTESFFPIYNTIHCTINDGIIILPFAITNNINYKCDIIGINYKFIIKISRIEDTIIYKNSSSSLVNLNNCIIKLILLSKNTWLLYN